MDSIVSIIEDRVQSGNAKTTFTYLRDGERDAASLSLLDVRETSVKLAALLSKQKTPVLIMLPQGLSFITALYGCLYAGAIAVPIAVPSRNRGLGLLQNIIKDTKTGLIISDRDTHSKVTQWFPGESFADIGWLFIEDVENSEPVEGYFEMPKACKPAFIQYTSGSTGEPKGVVITHENIIENSRFIRDCSGNTEQSSVVFWLPCFHDMGLIGGIFQPVFANFKSVMMSPTHFIQKPIRWFSAITKYTGTISAAPNFGFDYCADRIKDEELKGIDLSSITSLYNGSETIQPETLRKFVGRFKRVGLTNEKIFTCYGLAESTLAVTVLKGARHENLKLDEDALRNGRVKLATGKDVAEIVSTGTPDPDSVIKIVEPETIEECPDDAVGEILVAGKSIAAGFYNRQEETLEAFVELKNRRFLRTGDLGFIRDGELFVTGRIKDLIIIRGKNHYPQDIEQTVMRSDKVLAENSCAAFSIIRESGESLVIVQEIRRDAVRNADFEATIARIVNAISRDHGIQPYDVVLIKPGSLPKTTSGKVRRKKCLELWKSNALDKLANYARLDR